MTTNNQEQNPLEILLKALAIMFLAVVFLIVLNGCKAQPIESTKTKETVTEVQNDTVKKTVINGAVNDSLKIAIPVVHSAKPECDSLLQVELERTLKLLNSYKKSGENEQGIRYNALKKQLEMWQKMAQTKNESTKIVYKYKYIKGETQITEVPVRYVPWWVKYLACIGAVTSAYVVYRISRIFWA
jgi:hypothetical protein